MSAWTKGPWVVEDPETDCRPGWSWVSAPEHSWYGLAEVVTRMDGDTQDSPVGRSNAHLIAAAPCLAEALERALMPMHDAAFFLGDSADDAERSVGAILWSAYENARAALRRAKGEA